MKWPVLTAKVKLRGKRPPHYGTKGDRPTWTGIVIRRDPTHYQRPSEILRMCGNRFCRLWIGSTIARCPHCHCPQ